MSRFVCYAKFLFIFILTFLNDGDQDIRLVEEKQGLNMKRKDDEGRSEVKKWLSETDE